MEIKDPATDLCERLHRLWLRYNVVFREPTPANPPYIPLAESVLRGLADEDKWAVIITRSVVDQAEEDQPAFWGTPLGRLLFVAGGYPYDTCAQAVAAAVLGCSRQWVSAMVSDGKLSAADRGVHAEQVRQVLKSRANRLQIDKTVK